MADATDRFRALTWELDGRMRPMQTRTFEITFTVEVKAAALPADEAAACTAIVAEAEKRWDGGEPSLSIVDSHGFEARAL
jgi:hypothetical protein